MQVATSLNSALAKYYKKSEVYNKNEIDGSNTYSTEEVDTGKTWIDGKKIYRKVIQGVSPSKWDDSYCSIYWFNIQILDNVDTIINYFGYQEYERSGQINREPIPFSRALWTNVQGTTQNWATIHYKENSQGVIRYRYESATSTSGTEYNYFNKPFIIIIEYTKL